jgi:hypothetical protein
MTTVIADRKEETTEEKLAKSTGADTEKYSATLEADADALIETMYGDKEEPEKKAEAAPEKEEEPEKEEKAEEIIASDDDTMEVLKEKLERSEKRVRDNQSAYTKNRQDLKDQKTESEAVISGFKDTINELQQKLIDRPNTETKSEKEKTDGDIKGTISDLTIQFEALESIDPDMAKPIKEIISSLNGQISGLKSELGKKDDAAVKSAQQIADEKHFGAIDKAHPGWEKVLDSADFETYKETLSPRQKKLVDLDLDQGSAENVIEIFDDFKAYSNDDTETVKTDDKSDAKSEKLAAAKKMANPDLKKSKSIKTSSTPKFTRASIKAMSPEEFLKNEAAIDEEMAAGNII